MNKDKRKRYEAQQNKEFWQRACKSTGKLMPYTIELTPARKMDILEQYIGILRALQQEIWNNYTQEERKMAQATIWRDLQDAVTKFAELKLEQILPPVEATR